MSIATTIIKRVLHEKGLGDLFDSEMQLGMIPMSVGGETDYERGSIDANNVSPKNPAGFTLQY